MNEFLCNPVLISILSRTKIMFTILKGDQSTNNLIYRQTCTERSPLGQRKNGLIRQVTFQKRFNLYGIFSDRTRKM
jgi:hypothetical protein